ncbi:hypothetical protein B0H19DRAFT_1080513 [Mycena capillaripes]|nr:hypothetical protein B0H19DRAFT_1080513 [Mycena capillaripes]
MATTCDTTDYIGFFPLKANGKMGTVGGGEAVLMINTLRHFPEIPLYTMLSFTPSNPGTSKVLLMDDILEELTTFQARFYARQPQLHPVLNCLASIMLRLDHYEPYVADAMIISCCTFIGGSCLEVRALTKRVAIKFEAKLWPSYAILEILIFIKFLNEVLMQVSSSFFYKEEIDGEQYSKSRHRKEKSKEADMQAIFCQTGNWALSPDSGPTVPVAFSRAAFAELVLGTALIRVSQYT